MMLGQMQKESAVAFEVPADSASMMGYGGGDFGVTESWTRYESSGGGDRLNGSWDDGWGGGVYYGGGGGSGSGGGNGSYFFSDL